MLPTINGTTINGDGVSIHTPGLDLLVTTPAVVAQELSLLSYQVLEMGTGAVLNDADSISPPVFGLDLLRIDFHASIENGQPAPDKVVRPPSYRVLELPRLEAQGEDALEVDSYVVLELGTGEITAHSRLAVETAGVVLELGAWSADAAFMALTVHALELGQLHERAVVPARGIDLLRTTFATIMADDGRDLHVAEVGSLLELGAISGADAVAQAATFFPLELGTISVGRSATC